MASEGWELTRALRTDAGMFCLWQPEYFAGVTDQDSWEDWLSEDVAISRHVAAGAFVPVNLGVDGAFQFMVRGGGGDLPMTTREMQYLAVSSDPYLLIARGPVVLSGLEAVGAGSNPERLPIPLNPGRYAVTIRILDWSAEPGAMDSDGEPGPNALPDFMVEIRPDVGVAEFRSDIETFERPQ